jgi:hypothetical protein
MRFLIFAVLLLVGVGCSESGKRKPAEILVSGERFYISTDLYTSGDTIIVRWDAGQWVLDKGWMEKTTALSRNTEYGSFYKAVIR